MNSYIYLDIYLTKYKFELSHVLDRYLIFREIQIDKKKFESHY